MVYKKICLFSVNLFRHLKLEIVSTIPASNDKKWKQIIIPQHMCGVHLAGIKLPATHSANKWLGEKSHNRKNAPQNTIYIIKISLCKWDHPAFGVCVYYVRELIQWWELCPRFMKYTLTFLCISNMSNLTAI